MEESLTKRLDRITERIARAALKDGRQLADVQLVAVTKMVPAELLGEAVACGLKALGENRVQDWLTKYEAWGDRVEWHLIGHLQQNKARYLTGRISLLHSLDSLRLAQQLDGLSSVQGRPWRVLVQVNVSGEATKYGLSPEELPGLLDATRSLKGLDICGLMTIAPYVNDPEEVRPVFRRLRLLQSEVSRSRPWLNLQHLSMGMSNDFEIAVEEGATLVRIGSALFGY
ncbi:MAG: YggS family pyridoxal phosphate-dependent enzyme [Thermacetogeniaceae bacterium]